MHTPGSSCLPQGIYKEGGFFSPNSLLDRKILQNIELTDVLNILCMRELWGILLSVLQEVSCEVADL